MSYYRDVVKRWFDSVASRSDYADGLWEMGLDVAADVDGSAADVLAAVSDAVDALDAGEYATTVDNGTCMDAFARFPNSAETAFFDYDYTFDNYESIADIELQCGWSYVRADAEATIDVLEAELNDLEALLAEADQEL